MNVLRMIKLFGWEKKMSEKIAEKREEELGWLKKRQILGVCGANIKCVSYIFGCFSNWLNGMQCGHTGLDYVSYLCCIR